MVPPPSIITQVPSPLPPLDQIPSAVSPTIATQISDTIQDEANPVVAAHSTTAPLPSIFNKFSMTGKVAVVTGGAQGLGFQMAASLCSAGLAALAIIDINPISGEKAVKEMTTMYPSIAVKFYKTDITKEDQVTSVTNEIAEEFGGIDTLVCSAGIVDNYPAEDYPFSRFQLLMNINLAGSFLCAQAAFPHLKARGGGSIVFIGSMSGHIVNAPQPQVAYNASKAGVIHMMKSLAVEWAPYNIRCNSISPGYMNTGLLHNFDKTLVDSWLQSTPMKRMGEPEELQGVVLWLASNASSFVTGSDVTVDGGYTAL
ncbi:hypothetical protein V1511DRAFT_505494 [Dipodascopsis uninucleata]